MILHTLGQASLIKNKIVFCGWISIIHVVIFNKYSVFKNIHQSTYRWSRGFFHWTPRCCIFCRPIFDTWNHSNQIKQMRKTGKVYNIHIHSFLILNWSSISTHSNKIWKYPKNNELFSSAIEVKLYFISINLISYWTWKALSSFVVNKAQSTFQSTIDNSICDSFLFDFFTWISGSIKAIASNLESWNLLS